MSKDLDAELQSKQHDMWASLWPTARFTTPVAGYLVDFAGPGPGVRVLKVGAETDTLVYRNDRNQS